MGYIGYTEDMKSELTKLYLQILEDLKADKRPLLEINEHRYQLIKTTWAKALENADEPRLKEVLCLLDHASHPVGGLTDFFRKTLDEDLSQEIKIFTLGASTTHVVTHSQLHGNPIDPEFIQCIRAHLHPKQDPELLEWLLRVIEAMGKQGLKLRKEVRDVRPGPLGHLSPHKRACRQIIDLLESQWSRYVP